MSDYDIVEELPLLKFRWLVREDGTKVLQQLHRVCAYERWDYEWVDIPEVRDD